MNYIIAIDGASGVGKGIVSSTLAKKLKFDYLNTGLYYRAISYIGKNDLGNVDKIYDKVNFKIEKQNVLYNNNDITEYLYTMENTSRAAYVSNNSKLREKINKDIRNYCKDKNIVVDGRDVGSNIFPNATVKIFLSASFDCRVKRRYLQLNKNVDIKKIENNIMYRDKIDNERENGRLTICNDSHVINTENKSIDEIVDEIMNIIRR